MRYIGIDTPETRKREGDAWVYVGEPLAEKVKDFNRRMVEGKVARLELDVQKKDKYGRLLAYCFVEDNFSRCQDVAGRPCSFLHHSSYIK